MVVTFPSAPAAPYSRVTTGMSGCVENTLYTPYCDAPSVSRRVQRTRRYMRSYKSTNSEPDSEPDLSSSMNGMPVFTMLSRIAWSMESRGTTNQEECSFLHARERKGRRRSGRMSLGDSARPLFVSLTRKARASPRGLQYCAMIDAPASATRANDIRYASLIPHSFMVHTMPACAARNSASGVSSFPGGRKGNERLHLSESLSAIDREGERGVGLPARLTDRHFPNADCGCQSIGGPWRGPRIGNAKIMR